MSLRDGAKVSYVGDGSDGRTLGERGKLLATAGRSGHVQWDDGKVELTPLDFLVTSTVAAAVEPQHDDLADSLDVGPIQAVGLRRVFDTEGGTGVLNAMATMGHLGSFQDIAEQALSFVEQQIRQDPSFRQAAVQLDDDEVDDVISLAAQMLCRDAFGEMGDE